MPKQLIFELAEHGPEKLVQLVKTGQFTHEKYGEIILTTSDLAGMKKNFESNARGLMKKGVPVLQFDYKHSSDERAAGWIKKLSLSEDGSQLFGVVDWTPAARQSIENEEWSFTSPTISRNYTNTDTGEVFDIVLTGAALTNIPFLKMDEIVLSETNNLQGGATMPTFEDVLKFLETATDEQKAEVSALVGKTPDAVPDPALAEKVALSESVNLELSEQVKILTKSTIDIQTELATAKKKTEFLQLLSESKVAPAQEAAYMKGDMVEFAKNAVNFSTTAAGQSPAGTPEIKTKEQAEDKLIELAETYAEKNKVQFHIALSEVQSKNTDLVKLTESATQGA